MGRGWSCPVWRASLFVTLAIGVEAADSGRVWGMSRAPLHGKRASNDLFIVMKIRNKLNFDLVFILWYS